MASTQLFPQVIDASTLGTRLTSPIYFPIAVEGVADSASPGTVGHIYSITRPADADSNFGSTSKLAQLVKWLLARGAAPVLAAASAKSDPPALSARQAVWDNFSSDPTIRLRLSDAETQAEFAALATSLNSADAIFNKQVGIVGMAVGTTKSQLISTAQALQSKRLVLVGPGIYDEGAPSTLRDGIYTAASIAAEVAKNPDPTNDLDRWGLPMVTGIENDSLGFPLLRNKTVGGSAVNDFEDLLQGGVSPVMEDGSGVVISHLRMTYTTDGTFDSLMTRLIVDQVFVDVRDYLMNSNYLDQPNTETVRGRIKSGVEALLRERESWISPKVQSDGSSGYNVNVVSSPDNRQVTVSYEGTVVRGISTIQVAASLDIPV